MTFKYAYVHVAPSGQIFHLVRSTRELVGAEARVEELRPSSFMELETPSNDVLTRPGAEVIASFDVLPTGRVHPRGGHRMGRAIAKPPKPPLPPLPGGGDEKGPLLHVTADISL